MDKYEEIASHIIDDVCEVVEEQYYDLECAIADKLRKLNK